MDLIKFYNQITPRLGAFLGVFFTIMLLGYGFLYAIDFIPEPVSDENAEENQEITSNNDPELVEVRDNTKEEETVAISNNDPYPTIITIPKLDRTVKVLNPSNDDVATLDNALLSGAVRHPGSADMQGPGNMLIMGHSSYLNNVFNKNFQAFNGIQDLTWGDTIIIESNDSEYTYQIDRVYKAPASAVEVPTGGDNYKLTLVTCNTFGAKEDRFIVEATLISQNTI